MSTSSADPVEPPDAVYVRQRFIPLHTVEWVKKCDGIMVKYGSVVSSSVYPARHQARWKARRLIRLMVELRLHERWQLVEHTERKGSGWIWSVEYLRRRDV